jgi:uncharacterized protein YndB with AHSA1/START domain
MTSDACAGTRTLASFGSAGGRGVVRSAERFGTDIGDLWAALTDPSRLARWYGEVDGDLRAGGEFRARVYASESECSGRVAVCEPLRRLLLVTRDADEPDENVIELALAADGGQSVLSLEQRGIPLDYLAACGAGIQVHVEDLAAHLAGRGRCDADARMDELFPAYQVLASGGG